MASIQHYIAVLSMLLSSVLFASDSPNTVTSGYLKPFRAVYKAKYHGIRVKALRELSELDNGTFQLRFEADSWIATITEISQFTWLSDAGNNKIYLQPLKYEYHREGLGRDRHAYLYFDWAKQRVINDVQNKPWSMDIPLAALDKLSYQLQMRQDLLQKLPLNGYQIADGGSLKHYTFKIAGEEWLDTKVGYLQTLKVERLRDHTEKRKTFIWFAPAWNYMIIRLQHWEDGKGYELNLDEATLDGTAVTGLSSSTN